MMLQSMFVWRSLHWHHVLRRQITGKCVCVALLQHNYLLVKILEREGSFMRVFSRSENSAIGLGSPGLKIKFLPLQRLRICAPELTSVVQSLTLPKLCWQIGQITYPYLGFPIGMIKRTYLLVSLSRLNEFICREHLKYLAYSKRHINNYYY